MPELGKTAGEIRRAWSLTRSGQQFAQEIDNRGLALVYLSSAEADTSHRSHAFAKAINRQSRAIREGFGVVDQRGNVTRIDQRVTGDLSEEIQKRLGGIDKDALLTVDQARDLMRHRNRDEFREKKQAERDQARPASFIGRKITDCENRAHVAGAIIQRDGSGQIVAGAAALADRLRPQDERQTETATIHGAEAFAARLDQAGIAIVRATDADVKIIDALRREEAAARLAAETNREAYKGNRFDRLQAGDVAAVNRRGDVFRLNPYRLDLERIERALTSSRTLLGVIEARAAFESNRAQTEKLWTRTKAASVERKAAFEQRRDVRSTVATAERAERKTFAAPAHAIDSGLKKTGLVLGIATKIVEAFISALDWTGGPKQTRQQAHDAARAAGNVETRHAEAVDKAAQANEAAVDWQQFEQNRARQYDDLINGRLQSTPATPKEIQRGDDRERERERER